MHFCRLLAGALSACLAATTGVPAWAADATPERSFTILQLRLIEGEGAIATAGTRSSRSVTVLATDETGRPLANAAISFRLPEEGPSGSFANGLKSDVVVTGPDGRASARGIHWGETSGPVQLRITAVKDQVRAGLICPMYITESSKPAAAQPSAVAQTPRHGKSRWLMVGLAAVGAAGAGVALGSGGAAKSSSGSTNTPSTPPTPIQIGQPTITIGGPK